MRTKTSYVPDPRLEDGPGVAPPMEQAAPPPPEPFNFKPKYGEFQPGQSGILKKPEPSRA